MCRHHVIEVHVKHLMSVLAGVKAKSPRREIYLGLQKVWSKIVDKIDTASDNLVRFIWTSLEVGSSTYNIAEAAIKFGETALHSNVLKKGDYKILCQLYVDYLGGYVPAMRFHQPRACHEARFTADAIYLLTLEMTKDISNLKYL